MIPLSLLLVVPAWAQDPPAPASPPEPAPVSESPVGPSPIARCADAAHGSEVEICLQLAVEHPDQIDGIGAALRAHIEREGSPDQALLLALLALVDDQTAPEAAARVAELGDPRGVPALVACAEQRRPAVAAPCIRSLAPFPAGLGHLRRWVVDGGQPGALQEVAVRTLGDVHSEPAADILVDALRQPRMSPTLRRVILDTIRSAYPERADQTEGQVASDGRVWLTLGGAWGMSFSMGAAGHFGQSDLAALGWTTGAVGGGTAGWLYGRAWPMEAGDAAYITTSGILGTTSGMLVGAGRTTDPGDGIYLGGLAGMAVGYAVPALTRTAHQGTGPDAVEATAVATATSIAAGTTVIFVQDNQGGNARTSTTPSAVERRRGGSSGADLAPTLASGIGLASGAAVGHLVAPHVDLSGGDGGLIALGSAWGLSAGLLVPVGGADRSTLPVITTASGALLGYGLAHPLEVPGDVQGAAWAGAAYGGAIGAGIGLLIDAESAAPSTMALGIGTAGLLAGGALAHMDPEPLDDRDLVLVAFSTGWATAQSAGWAGVIQPDREQAGWFVLAPAVVGAGTAVATPLIDVPVPQTAAATSLGLWGAYGAGVGAELADGDVLLVSLIGSNVGLAGGALVMSPLVGAPPVVIGVADAGGVLGGSVTALGAAWLTQEPDAILVSSLVGAGLGFAGGAVLGSTWKKGGTRDMARLAPGTIHPRWMVRPDMGPDRLGLALEVQQW